jgi:hypothetical protein
LRLLKSKAIRRLERNQPSNMVPQPPLDLVTSIHLRREEQQVIIQRSDFFFCAKQNLVIDFQGCDVLPLERNMVRFPLPTDTVTSTSPSGTTLTSPQKNPLQL